MKYTGKAFFIVFFVAVFCRSLALAAGNSEEGKKIYYAMCISCHGVGGVSKERGVPDFSKGLEKSDEAIKEIIRKGVYGGANPMPSFGKLSDKQLDDVVAYIRALKRK